jgi:hypothetical protein
MALPSEEAFTRLFRDLDDVERTAFAAELWAARGWETTVDGADVVATRDGRERRIRVCDPGLLGVPPVDGVDVLVPVRDRTAVQTAAELADVRYVPPAVLYEQLRYAVDRETAAALFESTFGQPLDAPGPHVSPPVSERFGQVVVETTRTARDGFGEPRLALGVLLVVVLVGVVVAGPVLTPDAGDVPQVDGTAIAESVEAGALGESSESSDSAAEATTPDGFPPGVGRSGITDLSTLLAAHEQGVIGRQRTLNVRATGPQNATFMHGRTAWNYTVRVQGSHHYRFDANYTYPPGQFSRHRSGADSVRIGVFANGGTNYRLRADATGTSYLRYPTEAAGGAWTFTTEVTRYLRYFLSEEQSRISCTESGSGGAGIKTHSCRIVVGGAPATIPDAASYRATVIVNRNGVVTSLAVSYTLPDSDGDGAREPVQFSISYESLDATTIAEPAWLPEAKNATSESSSA